MAFDGLTVAALVSEFSEKLTGARIYKIAQPEADELLLTCKTSEGQVRLMISANASLPLIRLTESGKTSPLTAPGFCMLLRKHLQNGRIIRIWQPGMERCIHFDIEHLDEMGDLRCKSLIVELMGKHSNIIFCEGDLIIDSIKHIPQTVSSVREVLPGRTYFLPDTQNKLDPLTVDEETFCRAVDEGTDLIRLLTGISPLLAKELYYRAEHLHEDADGTPVAEATAVPVTQGADLPASRLYRALRSVLSEPFCPSLYEKEYAAIPLRHLAKETCEHDTMSRILAIYYARNEIQTRIRQKSADLRHIVQIALDRNLRKHTLQKKQLADTEKRDRYRLYGELLTAYSYMDAGGNNALTCTDYYTGEEISIPLDPQKSIQENARKYYDRYGKLKRTYEALTVQIAETASEIRYLESVTNALEIAETEADLSEIRKELIEAGYVRSSSKNGTNKKKVPKGAKAEAPSKPLHYISSDGYDIYVGKNNLQNEYLTHKLASGNDWWFHAKECPGSHVIVLSHGESLPDRTFEEAARLAAHYSKASSGGRVEIDYVQKKHLKKVAGSKPGFVIYHTNYSMLASADINGIRAVTQ